MVSGVRIAIDCAFLLISLGAGIALGVTGLWRNQQLVSLKLLEKLHRVSEIEVGYTKWDRSALGPVFQGL